MEEQTATTFPLKIRELIWGSDLRFGFWRQRCHKNPDGTIKTVRCEGTKTERLCWARAASDQLFPKRKTEKPSRAEIRRRETGGRADCTGGSTRTSRRSVSSDVTEQRTGWGCVLRVGLGLKVSCLESRHAVGAGVAGGRGRCGPPYRPARRVGGGGLKQDQDSLNFHRLDAGLAGNEGTLCSLNSD